MAIDKYSRGIGSFASDVGEEGEEGEEEDYDIPIGMVVGGLDMKQLTWWLKLHDGDIAEVRRLLSESDAINVNGRDSGNMTPLMWAAHGGHIEIAELLLHAGANPLAVDVMHPDRAVTALDYAMGCGLPVVEGDSEDEEGPTGPNHEMVALIRSFASGPTILN